MTKEELSRLALLSTFPTPTPDEIEEMQTLAKLAVCEIREVRAMLYSLKLALSQAST